MLGEHSYPAESTKAATPFVIPDFAISTTSARIVYFTSSSSTPEVLDWGGKGGALNDISCSPQVLLMEHDASITALATHPFMPHLVTSGYTCKLKLWDYETK